MSGGGDSGSTTTNTTTIQKADPWEGQQPYLKDIFQQASAQFRHPGPYYYPGDEKALFTPQELQAQGNVQAYAQGGARDLLNQGLGSQSFLLGDVLRADSNPYMADYARGAISPVWDALTRVGLPTINSNAIIANQYGGSRHGLAQGMALGDATRQSFDTTAKMYSDMYGKNLDAMQKAVMMNEGVVKGGTLADQLLGAVGEDRRGMQQTLLDDAIARWEWEQALPAAKLSQYVGAVQGNYGGQSSSNTESEVPQQQTSAIGRISGAAMSGLGTYAALAGSMPMAAPWIGAAIGIASLFK